MSEEIVKKLLASKKKMIFESAEVSSSIPEDDEELLLDTDEDIFDDDIAGDGVEESTEVDYEPCVCGSTDISMEDGKAVCNACGRDLSIQELSEPLLPREDTIEESGNDKEVHLRSVIAVWNQGKYQRAMELCRRYGISDREFAFALVKSFRESEELVDDLEDALNEGAFKVFHYEIISKDSGRVIIKNFGYFDDENSFWKNMNGQYPKKKFIVKMVKPLQKTNESKKIKEDADMEFLSPNSGSEDNLDKNIIRAIQTPVSTANKPDLDAAIMEAMKGRKVKESADVDTSKWSFNNGGKKPSGYGIWWFKIGSEEKDFSGMYADAKKKAIQYAREKGIQRIILLT